MLVYLIFFIVIDYSYKNYADKKDDWTKLEYYAGLLGFVITLVAMQGSVLSRMGIYFAIFFCVSVPNALYRIPNRQTRYLLATSVILGCFLYNLVIFVFRPYWSGVLPYIFLD